MNHIKELMCGSQEHEGIHQRFVKYSKGVFEGGAIELKRSGDKIKIKGSFDYSDIVGELLAKNSPGKISFSGTIASKKDIKTSIPLGKTKKKLGTVTAEIKGEAEARQLADLYEQNPEAQILVEMESSSGKLKSKKKPPKPGSGLDTEFFSAELSASLMPKLLDELCFDVPAKDLKEAKIAHTYSINEIVIPEEYRKDFSKARLYAKRKGSAKRRAEIDGKVKETEKEILV